ncbi:MAG: M28 family peptidase [Planctomycetes bacterium]|nr:M28 family peptidase [Planctomycetota bacterium]
MRFALAFVLAGLLVAAPAVAADRLALIDYGPDLGLRDLLIHETPVFADLGASVVARVSDPLAARLAAAGVRMVIVPEPLPGQRLAAAFSSAPTWRPAGVRILAVEPGLFLVSGSPGALAALRRPGLFGGAVVDIPLAASYAPAVPFVAAGLDAPDPRVAAVVDRVQQVNLVQHLTALTTIYTRNARRAENAQAVAYIKSELEKHPGLVVKVESFSTTYGSNVIAELRGYDTPDEIVMVGAHLDSIAGSTSTRSPGADDNGSGTASVLELARIFAATPMQKTMRFGLWNAEEYGLVGSAAYAAAAKTRGDKILAYLNTDMNAYRASGDTVDVDFITNDSTPSLISYLTTISLTYVPTLGVKSGPLSAGTSDHRSFYRNGYPAVFYFEDLDQYSPYIHSSNDDMVRSANDMNLSTLITKSLAAGLAELALPLAEPSFALSTTAGPSVGGTQVTATGALLASTNQVKVGGESVPFTVSAGQVSFETPTSATVGNVNVEIFNPAGPGKAGFTYHLTSPAALRMPASLGIGTTGGGAVGGSPGYLSVTLLSAVLGSTNLGVATVDIGGGSIGNLVFYHIAMLTAGGGTTRFPIFVPNDARLRGYKFYFQAGVVEPSLQSISKTTVATVAVE